jgi:hypothetical protein
MNTIEKAKIGGLVVAGIAASLVLYKLGSFLGLFKSKEEKEQAATENKLLTGATADVTKIDLKNGSLCLSPNYYFTIYNQIVKDYKKQNRTAPKSSFFLGQHKYSELVTEIYNSKGTVKDDMPRVFGVFTQLNSQIQIAFLSNLFYKIYKRDLLNFFLSYTNTEERAQLYKIISSKKLY